MTGINLLAHLLKLLLANVIRFLVTRHLIRQSTLERQGFLIHILTPGKNARGDPAVVRRCNDSQIVSFTHRQHGVPQILGVLGGFLQIDLVAFLAGETGLGNDYIMTRHLAFHQPVKRNVFHPFPEQIRHQRL